MKKDYRKASEEHFLCLAEQFYKLRLITMLKTQEEDVETLVNNISYMEAVYIDCVSYARTHYYKVARFMGEKRNISLKHVDINHVLEKLRDIHQKMIFLIKLNKQRNVLL